MAKHQLRAAELTALSQQIDSLGTRIATLNTAGERAFALSVTVLAIVVTASISFEIYWVLVGAPLLLGVLGTVSAYVASEMHALAGYQAALEQRANLLLGRNVYIWESRLSRGRHKDFAARLSTIPAIGAIIGVIGAAIWSAAILSATVGPWLVVVVSIIWPSLAIGILVAIAMSGSTQHARYFARSAAELEKPVS